MHRVLVADKLAAAGMDILRAARDVEVDEAIGLKPAANTRFSSNTP